jgi:hypothetical protein
MRSIIRNVLVLLRVIERPDLVGRVQADHPSPESLKPGLLVIVKDGQIEKWVCFMCPGPCGEKVMLPLSRKRNPHWRVKLDWLNRPTIEPSVHQTNQSRCHFWVRGGKIVWCDD